MNTQNKRFNESDYENKESHISHKKKALAQQKRNRQDRVDEMGFDDEADLKQYERYIK